MKINPEKYVFPKLADALDQVFSTPNVILFCEEKRVVLHYRQNVNLPAVKRIREPKNSYLGLLFPKNSAIAPNFKLFGAKALQNGLMQRISTKWFGDTIPELKQDNATSLTFGHFVLCFTFFAVLTIASIFLLIAEKMFFKTNTKKAMKIKTTSKMNHQKSVIKRYKSNSI